MNCKNHLFLVKQGRERELKRLTANFSHGINTILMAPRRWGKTSLVKRTMSEIKNDYIKVIYIDAYFCRNEYDFYNHFAECILHQTNSKFEQWAETAGEFLMRLTPKISSAPTNRKRFFNCRRSSRNGKTSI